MNEETKNPQLTVNVEYPISTEYCYYEVQPCKTFIDKDGVNVAKCEEGDTPEFWGIYGAKHQEDGSHLLMNVADCQTEELARSTAKIYMAALLIAKIFGGI